MHLILLYLLSLLIISCSASCPLDYESKLIWNFAPHNAFTSLIVINDELYLAFREGNYHVDRKGGDDGVIRVLKSTDGKTWRPMQKIEMLGFDLRDPQLIVSPNGNPIIYFVCKGM